MPSAYSAERPCAQSDDPYLSHATLDALLPRLAQSRALMDELLRHLQRRPSNRRRHLHFAYHQDPGQAIMTGVVAAASVLIAGLFWYYSGWSDGYVAVMITGVVCSLFATADNPLIPAKGIFVYNLLALPIAS